MTNSKSIDTRVIEPKVIESEVEEDNISVSIPSRKDNDIELSKSATDMLIQSVRKSNFDFSSVYDDQEISTLNKIDIEKEGSSIRRLSTIMKPSNDGNYKNAPSKKAESYVNLNSTLSKVSDDNSNSSFHAKSGSSSNANSNSGSGSSSNAIPSSGSRSSIGSRSSMNYLSMNEEDDGTDIMAKTMDFLKRVSAHPSPTATPSISDTNTISCYSDLSPSSPDYYDTSSQPNSTIRSSSIQIIKPFHTEIGIGNDNCRSLKTDEKINNIIKKQQSSLILQNNDYKIDWLSLSLPLSKAAGSVLYDNNKDNVTYGTHTMDELRNMKVQVPLTRTMTLSMLSFAKEMDNKQNTLLHSGN